MAVVWQKRPSNIKRNGHHREWGVPVFPDVEKARSYVTAPWDDKPFPQFIPVDGGYRVACALESARRAKIACLCIGGANV